MVEHFQFHLRLDLPAQALRHRTAETVFQIVKQLGPQDRGSLSQAFLKTFLTTLQPALQNDTPFKEVFYYQL